MNLDTSVLLPMWKRMSSLPMGKWAFMRVFFQMVPYTGSTGAEIDELDVGYCKVLLRDKRSNRNHLNCLHAVALANVGEFSSGLAVITGLPVDARGILKGLHVNYFKKARGTITVECRLPKIETNKEQVFNVKAELKNSDGELVAEVVGDWLVGPRPKKDK